MESPFYSLVPKDVKGNLAFRKEMLRAGGASKTAAEELWIMCARDILFYANVFCYVFEPRKAAILPFITYEYQDRALATLQDLMNVQSSLDDVDVESRDLVVEKSRDMGASWMCILTLEHRWHFYDRSTFLLLSRKEDLVDSRGEDPRSLFAKVDFLHEYQPGWLLPNRERMKMHLSNLDLRGSMDGESTNKFAGIADRRFALLLDEFSKMENQSTIFRGTRDVSDCRLFNFTPQGAGNMAYEIAHDDDTPRLTLHWHEHPIKSRGLYRVVEDGEIEILDTDYWTPARKRRYKFIDKSPYSHRFKYRSPWYDLQCRRAHSDKEIAQELDIDYLGSSYQYFSPSHLKTALSRALSPRKRGELDYVGETGTPTGFTEDSQGRLHLWTPLDATGNPPHRGRVYAVGVDPAAGTGATNSAICVGEGVTKEQVAEFVTPFLRPEELARYVVSLCRWFHDETGNPAMLIWEAPGPGREFGSAVADLGFWNVYYFRPKSRSAKAKKVPGWWPTKDEKRELLGEYRRAIYEGLWMVRSREQIDECRHFVFKPNGWIEHITQSGHDVLDPSGAKENHGDRPTAGALCWKLITTLFPDAARSLDTIDIPRTTKEEESMVMSQTAEPGSIMYRRQQHQREAEQARMW